MGYQIPVALYGGRIELSLVSSHKRQNCQPDLVNRLLLRILRRAGTPTTVSQPTYQK